MSKQNEVWGYSQISLFKRTAEQKWDCDMCNCPEIDY